MIGTRYSSKHFCKPPLIAEEDYISLKQKLDTNYMYNPFVQKKIDKVQRFGLLIYGVGVPISFFFISTGVVLLTLIGGLFMFVAFFGLISLIFEANSYSKYKRERNRYYETLLSNIKESNDYYHFKLLMN